MIKIGRILRRRRLAFGLTMRQIHKRGGPTPAYQCDVERGKREGVTIPMFLRWCRALGCDPMLTFADIIGEENRPPLSIYTSLSSLW